MGSEHKNTRKSFKFIKDANDQLVDIETPEHLRPDIELDASWYKCMMRDIRSRLIELLENRGQSIELTPSELGDMALKVHAEACYLALSEPEPSGAQGGRRRDIGAEISARSALNIAEIFNLPGRGSWEESVSGDLLNLIETIARDYKERLHSVSFKRRYRLEQGKKWSITPL